MPEAKREVTMLSSTERPTLTMMYAFMNMHHKLPEDIYFFEYDQIEKHSKRKFEKDIKPAFIQMLADNPHNTVLEYVKMNFMLKGFSRALQQQLTRNRDAGYSIQSLRIVDISDKEDFEYHIPDRIKRNEAALAEYEYQMENIRCAYTKMQEFPGIKVEDARGLLPLNIASPITMTINLRSMVRMASFRLCHLAQGEFRDLVEMMIEEICAHLGQIYRPLFRRPCEIQGYCPMPINCEKTKYKQKMGEYSIFIKEWLKG